jgi:hypothetical protein
MTEEGAANVFSGAPLDCRPAHTDKHHSIGLQMQHFGHAPASRAQMRCAQARVDQRADITQRVCGNHLWM